MLSFELNSKKWKQCLFTPIWKQYKQWLQKMQHANCNHNTFSWTIKRNYKTHTEKRQKSVNAANGNIIYLLRMQMDYNCVRKNP